MSVRDKIKRKAKEKEKMKLLGKMSAKDKLAFCMSEYACDNSKLRLCELEDCDLYGTTICKNWNNYSTDDLPQELKKSLKRTIIEIGMELH